MTQLARQVAEKWRKYPDSYRFCSEMLSMRCESSEPPGYEDVLSPMGEVLQMAGWNPEMIRKLDGNDNAREEAVRIVSGLLGLPASLVALMEAHNQFNDGLNDGPVKVVDMIDGHEKLFGANHEAVIGFFRTIEGLKPGSVDFSPGWKETKAYVDAIRQEFPKNHHLSMVRDAIFESGYGVVPSGGGDASASAYLDLEAAAYETLLGDIFASGAGVLKSKDIAGRFRSAALRQAAEITINAAPAAEAPKPDGENRHSAGFSMLFGG